MNWITRLALSIGLKKTESWVAQHDQLPPDNDLAAAETLGSKTTRAGLLVIGISLAHAGFLWLGGTLTSDQLVSHAETLCYGLAIIFGRHAFTKYNLDAVRDQLKKALPPVMLALGLGLAFIVLAPAGARAQAATNQTPVIVLPAPATNAAPGAITLNTFTDLLSALKNSTEVHTGYGADLNGHRAVVMEEQVTLVTAGRGAFRTRLGLGYATLFTADVDRQAVGLSASWQLATVPPAVAGALDAAKPVTTVFETVYGFLFAGEPPEDYAALEFDYRHTLFAAGLGFTFQ
jgi:hypothetical protein